MNILTPTYKLKQRSKDITATSGNVAADVILEFQTCGIQPFGISDPRYALPGDKAAFANRVLSVLLPNSSDKSEENSVAHRRSLLYQSTTTLKVTQAMAVAIEQTPLANGLRRAQNTVKFPAEALAFAATIVSQLHVQNAYTNVSIDRNATQAHA